MSDVNGMPQMPMTLEMAKAMKKQEAIEVVKQFVQNMVLERKDIDELIFHAPSNPIGSMVIGVIFSELEEMKYEVLHYCIYPIGGSQLPNGQIMLDRQVSLVVKRKEKLVSLV